MELLNSFPLLFFIFINCLFFILLIKRLIKARTPKLKLPPGPWKLPIIGSMHHLLGSLTHHVLTDLAKIHGPLMHLKLGEISAVVISSAEAAKEIMKTHDHNFSSRPNLLASRILLYNNTDIVFAPYGEYWRQLKKLYVLELVSAKRVQSFRPVREEETLDLIRTIHSTSLHSPVNLSELLLAFSNNMIARITFGNKCRDAKDYVRAIRQGFNLGSGFKVAELFPSLTFLSSVTGLKSQLESCHRKVDGILERIIEEFKERREAKEKFDAANRNIEGSFLDVLFNLQEKGGLWFQLTTTSIKAIIYDAFAAGSGSSASIIIWTMSELMRNPRVMKKVQSEVRKVLGEKANITEGGIKELSYLQLVIKEGLRLHPPAPLLVPRESMEKCEIQGYEIPAKTRVVINAWAIGRDSKYWEEPELFMPERFEGSLVDFKGNNYEFLPFGAGRRMCPGILFGVATIEIVLTHLLYYFDWNLPDEMTNLDMTETSGVGARRKYDLSLCATLVSPY